jgi:hypothetical protein
MFIEKRKSQDFLSIGRALGQLPAKIFSSFLV